MPGYSFRFDFRLAHETGLYIDSIELDWPIDKGRRALKIASLEKQPIKNSKNLMMVSDGWPSRKKARKAGEHYRDILMLTFAKLQIGADFYFRNMPGDVATLMKKYLEIKDKRPIINVPPGEIIVYKTEKSPLVSKISADILFQPTKEEFENIFSLAIEQPRIITERERLSFAFFNSSFFQESPEVKFILRIMAVEALLEQLPRSNNSQAHVQKLIKITQDSNDLPQEEKDSLMGSLFYCLEESFRRRGGILAKNRLGNRKYNNKGAASFWKDCYDLRSKMVHGKPPLPSPEEIESLEAQLKLFVLDLLVG